MPGDGFGSEPADPRRRPKGATRAALLALLMVAASCGGPDADTASPPSPQETPEPAPTTPSPSPTGHEPRTGPPVVWVAAEDAGTVSEVDVEAGEVLRTVAVPGHPHNLAVGGGTVATALQQAGTVALVRGDRVRTANLGGSPHDVKPAGDRFLVANEGAARLDLISPAGEHLGSVSLRADPHDVAVAPDGRTAWASLNGDDALAVVDLDAEEVRRYVPTGERPHDLLFAPDGRLWVTDWEHGIHVFSPRGQHVHTVDIGDEPHHLTFTPDGEEAWITDHGSGAVHMISTEAFEVLEELPVPAPHHVAITSDGRFAAVAAHDDGTLVVFDVERRRRVHQIPVGAGPHGVWLADAPEDD